MSEKIVSSRAKWNLQELIPVILVLGLGLLSLYAYVSEMWQSELAIIGMVVGFGLLAYLLYLNFNRKRKSTLFADLKNDDKYGISVWMRKPLKHKWNGKLDKGKNEASLADTRFVVMESVMSTRVIVFNVGKGKNLYVPVRLVAENQEARFYIIEAVEALGKKLKFKKEDDKTEFEQILLGEGDIYKKETVSTSFDSKGNPTRKTKEQFATDVNSNVSSTETNDENVEEDTEPVANGDEVTMPATPVVATRVIGYDKYAKKTVTSQIDEVIGNLNSRLDEESQEKQAEFTQLTDDLLGGKNNSIVIELPGDNKKK